MAMTLTWISPILNREVSVMDWREKDDEDEFEDEDEDIESEY